MAIFRLREMFWDGAAVALFQYRSATVNFSIYRSVTRSNLDQIGMRPASLPYSFVE